jgi:hypothetical protein
MSSLLSNPANINLNAGANPFAIRLSALTSGVNYLYFSKSGDGGFYTNLPPLILTVNKNYFTAVSFIETSFKLPINSIGSNYNLVVTLPSTLYPMEQVDLTVTLSSSVGISLKNNPTVISFYPAKTVATIFLYINDATLWTVGATTNLIFTPSASTLAYAAGTSIPLTAVALANIPVLTMTQSAVSVNNISYSVKCSEEGKFIYHLSRKFSYNLTACTLNQTTISYWLNQASLNSLRVAETYYQCNDIIGSKNIASNVTTVITIKNLLASTAYQINGFCETQ